MPDMQGMRPETVPIEAVAAAVEARLEAVCHRRPLWRATDRDADFARRSLKPVGPSRALLEG